MTETLSHEDFIGEPSADSSQQAQPKTLSHEEFTGAPEAASNVENYGSWAGPLQPAVQALHASTKAGRIPLASWATDIASAGTLAGLGVGPGDTFSKRYDAIRQNQIAEQEASWKQHPIASAVGALGAGAMLPGFGAETIGPKAAEVVAQKIGPGLLSKTAGVAGDVVGSTALGAGYGAAGGLEEPGTTADKMASALQAAKTGAEFGAIVPAAAGVVNPIAGKIIQKFRGAEDTEAEAARRVRGALESDWATRQGAVNRGAPLENMGMTPQQAIEAGSAEQPWMIGDIGGAATRGLARSAKNVSPEAQNILEGATMQRFRSQQGRTADYIRGVFGDGADAGAVRDALQKQAKDLNGPAYRAAYDHPNAQGMWNDGFADLMEAPAVQKAVSQAETLGKNVAVGRRQQPVQNPFVKDENGHYSLRTNPDGTTAYPTLEFWDKVKQGLDDQQGAAYRAGEKNVGNSIRDVNSHLKNLLDNAVPEYADARRGAAAFFGAEDAHEAGTNFLKNMNVYSLADARKALGKMNDPERELFARGMAADLINRAERRGDATNVARLFDSVQSRQKLEEGLGSDRAAQIEAYVRRESIMHNLYGAVHGNSSTAMQLAGMAALGAAGTAGVEQALEHGKDIMEHPFASAGAISAATAGALAHRYAHGVDSRVMGRVAEMLTSNDPQTINKIMQSSSRDAKLRDALRRIEMGVSKEYGAVRAPAASREERAQGGSLRAAKDVGYRSGHENEKDARHALHNGHAPIASIDVREDKKSRHDGDGLETKDDHVNSAAYHLDLRLRAAREDNKRSSQKGKLGRAAFSTGGALASRIDQARKNLSETTKSLMDMPDEHIAAALRLTKH